MKIKKIMGALLATTMLLGLTACGDSAAKKQENYAKRFADGSVQTAGQSISVQKGSAGTLEILKSDDGTIKYCITDNATGEGMSYLLTSDNTLYLKFNSDDTNYKRNLENNTAKEVLDGYFEPEKYVNNLNRISDVEYTETVDGKDHVKAYLKDLSYSYPISFVIDAKTGCVEEYTLLAKGEKSIVTFFDCDASEFEIPSDCLVMDDYMLTIALYMLVG